MTMLADKPWLKQYDAGVPETVTFENHPLQKFLEDSAENQPNRTAIIMKGYRISFRELNTMANNIAAALSASGFAKGDHAAICMPNCPQFVIAYYGILKAGGVVTASNPLYTERELEHQLNDCGAETVFVLSSYYEQLKRVQPKTKVRNIICTNIKEYFPLHLKILFTLLKERKTGHYAKVRDDDTWFQDYLKLGASKEVPKPTVSGDDIALLQYTGGTTGLSKGAIALHRNLVANVYMIKAWMTDSKYAQEVVLTAIPLFHSYGMVTTMHYCMFDAATMIMIPDPRDQADVLNSISKYATTIFPGVPAMYNAINHNPDVIAGKYDLTSVRNCISGSAPLLVETKETFERLTGGKLVEGYGMTETHVATHANPIFGKNVPGSIGIPLPNVECRIVGVDDPNKALGPGETGELVIKSPSLMPGYWQLDAETADSMHGDWFKTGDIVEMDEDGYFYIRDRKKDMILAGGYNVYPRELEEVLATHSDIVDVAVIGIPNEKRGEEPVAYIVKDATSMLTEDDFVAWGKSQFAAYKYPRKVIFVDELPKSTVGKILKRELRNRKNGMPKESVPE